MATDPMDVWKKIPEGAEEHEGVPERKGTYYDRWFTLKYVKNEGEDPTEQTVEGFYDEEKELWWYEVEPGYIVVWGANPPPTPGE